MAISVNRGLNHELAALVTYQLMPHDALGAHARDELGLSEIASARPIQGALASAGTFAVNAVLPVVAALAPRELVSQVVTGSGLLLLAILGALAARNGGAPLGPRRRSHNLTRCVSSGSLTTVPTSKGQHHAGNGTKPSAGM